MHEHHPPARRAAAIAAPRLATCRRSPRDSGPAAARRVPSHLPAPPAVQAPRAGGSTGRAGSAARTPSWKHRPGASPGVRTDVARGPSAVLSRRVLCPAASVPASGDGAAPGQSASLGSTGSQRRIHVSRPPHGQDRRRPRRARTARPAGTDRGRRPRSPPRPSSGASLLPRPPCRTTQAAPPPAGSSRCTRASDGGQCGVRRSRRAEARRTRRARLAPPAGLS